MDFQTGFPAVLIGAATGLRTMTGLAVISWSAHVGWIDLSGSALALLGSMPALVVLTAGAIGEYVADKLPQTGKRTAPGPLIARTVCGGLCGAAVDLAVGQPWIFGAALAAIGAVLGSFAGYYARVGLVRKLQAADIVIALPEDLLAIGLSTMAILLL